MNGPDLYKWTHVYLTEILRIKVDQLYCRLKNQNWSTRPPGTPNLSLLIKLQTFIWSNLILQSWSTLIHKIPIKYTLVHLYMSGPYIWALPYITVKF